MTLAALPDVGLADGLEVPVVVLAAVLGAVIGSFLNVVVYRLPAKVSLSHPASHCPHCDSPIRPRDNVPVFGWLLLAGKCRDCQAPISVRYPLVEALTAALFAVVAAAVVHRPALLPGYLFFTAVLVALAFIDLDTRRLPNALTFPLVYVGAPLLVLAALLTDSPDRLVPAAVGAASMWLFYALLWFGSRGKGIGLGDVKLAVGIGLFLGFLGWKAWIVGLLGAIFSGGVVGVALLAAGLGRKYKIPFGPYMAIGAVVGITLYRPVVRVWLGDTV